MVTVLGSSETCPPKIWNVETQKYQVCLKGVTFSKPLLKFSFYMKVLACNSVAI